MKTPSKSLIAISTAAFVCVSALAVARGADQIVPESFGASRDLTSSELCPPSACSIAFKTAEGGPPSKVVHVD